MLGYIYPCSGNWTYGPTGGANGTVSNQNGAQYPLYPSINHGVETPNDGDYIQYYMFRPGGAGTPNEFFMDFQPLVVIPNDMSDIYLRIRYRMSTPGTIFYEGGGNLGTMGCYYHMQDESGNVFNAICDGAIFSGVNMQNVNIPFGSVSASRHTSSGNFAMPASGDIGQNFGKITESYMQVMISYNNVDQSGNYAGNPYFYGTMYISEMEIVSSGDFIFGPLVQSTPCYIKGANFSKSGVPLYVYGEQPLASSTTLYTHGPTFLDAPSGVSLYTQGPLPATNGLTLYTQGPLPALNDVDLYIQGPLPQDAPGVPLTIFGELVHRVALPITYAPSFVHESGTFKNSDLFRDHYFSFADSGTITYDIITDTHNRTWYDNVSGTATVYGSPYIYGFGNSPDSGHISIFPPGYSLNGWYDGAYGEASQCATFDGTFLTISSNDYLQTSDILPLSGNYSFMTDMTELTWGEGLDVFGSSNFSSGSMIIFDSCALKNNGYNIIFTTNGYNGPTVGYSYYTNTSFIVSYDGSYHVWQGISNIWTKMYSSAPTPRQSSLGYGVFAPLGQQTSGNVIYYAEPFHYGGSTETSAYAIMAIGSIASGISDADVRLMNFAQTSMTEILDDTAPEPQGFVRYNAYGGNEPLEQLPQSFLPDGTINSGTTSDFYDNVGTYTSGYVADLNLNYYSNLSSGMARIYDYPNDSIMFSGWINSDFSGDFRVSLLKDQTTQSTQTYNYNYPPYTYTTNVVTTKFRYKDAHDTLTIMSGYHLYTKTLGYLLEANFDEVIQYNTITSSGSYSNTSFPISLVDNLPTKRQNWDLAELRTSSVNGTVSSGDIFNYTADIHNAVILGNYVATPPSNCQTGMTLYINGAMTQSSGVDLFIENKPNAGMDLFLKVVDPVDISKSLNLTMWTVGSSSGYATGSMPLYTENGANGSGGIPLFIWSENGADYSGHMPLFMQGQVTYYGHSGIQLVAYNNLQFGSGHTTLYTASTIKTNANTPLFLLSNTHGNYSGEIPMYIRGKYAVESGHVPLFITAPRPAQSSVPLLVTGSPYRMSGSITLHTRNNYYDLLNGHLPLVVGNKLNASGGITFHTIAGFQQAHTPFYLKALDDSQRSGITPLFIYSAGHSGVYQSTSLYIDSAGIGGKFPLFLKTDESASTGNTIPLYIKAGNSFERSVELYVESVRQSGGSINFNVIGAGLNPGSNVLRNSATLYIARPNENIGNGVSLFLDGPSGDFNSVPLMISGGHYSTQYATFAMPFVTGHGSGGMNLFTHGF